MGVLLRERRSLSRSICSDASALILDAGVVDGIASVDALSEDTEFPRERCARPVDGTPSCSVLAEDDCSAGCRPKAAWLSAGEETLCESLDGVKGLVLCPAVLPLLSAEMR